MDKIIRIVSKYFTYKMKHCLASCGDIVSFDTVDQIVGANYIRIGNHCSFCKGLVLTAWDKYQGGVFCPQITIGDDCHFGMYNNITCINKIKIGPGLLTGKWVTITDNSHGNNSPEEVLVSPVSRELYSKGEVIIGKNVWIGDKATILPNVKVGDGAVIAANAVVTKNVPPYTIVAGVPAKVIKQINICQNQD